jgi:hypothetical protein
MKILLFAVTLTALSFAGCATDQDRLEDPNHPIYNNNANNPGEHFNKNAPGYDAGGHPNSDSLNTNTVAPQNQ